MSNQEVIVSCKATEGTQVISTGNLYRIIANGTQTNQRFSLMEVTLAPGQGAPLHIHTREDEAFFILEGQVTFYLKDAEIHAEMEDFVSCPPDTIRGFRNISNATARMLLFYSKAGIEQMTLESGTLVADATEVNQDTETNTLQCPILSEAYGVVELDID